MAHWIYGYWEDKDNNLIHRCGGLSEINWAKLELQLPEFLSLHGSGLGLLPHLPRPQESAGDTKVEGSVHIEIEGARAGAVVVHSYLLVSGPILLVWGSPGPRFCPLPAGPPPQLLWILGHIYEQLWGETCQQLTHIIEYGSLETRRDW